MKTLVRGLVLGVVALVLFCACAKNPPPYPNTPSEVALKYLEAIGQTEGNDISKIRPFINEPHLVQQAIDEEELYLTSIKNFYSGAKIEIVKENIDGIFASVYLKLHKTFERPMPDPVIKLIKVNGLWKVEMLNIA